jgi:hypothetical protein
MSEETTVATTAPSKPKKAAAKKATKAPAKKAAAKSEGDGQRGRKSKYSGMKLTKLVDKNPRREGTHGHNSFSVIRSGMTYEKYIEAGGRLVDLEFDVNKGYVKVSK